MFTEQLLNTSENNLDPEVQDNENGQIVSQHVEPEICCTRMRTCGVVCITFVMISTVVIYQIWWTKTMGSL